MRKVMLQMQMSVGGFVDADDPDLAWQVWHWGGRPMWDEQLIADYNAGSAEVGAILLSREMVGDGSGGYIDHWPSSAETYPDDPALDFTRRVVSADEIVVSRSDVATSGPRTTATWRSLADVVGELCVGEGVTATVVGAGRRRLFDAGTRLRLLEARSDDCGSSACATNRRSGSGSPADGGASARAGCRRPRATRDEPCGSASLAAARARRARGRTRIRCTASPRPRGRRRRR